jgi:predicted transcriptional regulator of viral defense system
VTKKEEALTVLHGAGSATTQEVAEKGDMKVNTAGVTLARLKDEGRVDRTPEGRWHVT